MANADLSGSVDVDAIARALATVAVPEAACRDTIAAHVRGEDRRREIEAIQKAFVAERADDAGAYKPDLVALLACTVGGAYSTDKVWRLFRCVVETDSYYGVRLLDTNVSPVNQLAEQLAPNAEDPDRLLRDLVAWTELGDAAAFARLAPAAHRAGPLALREFGRTHEVGARLIDVLVIRHERLPDQLDALLAHAEEMVVEGALLAPLARWLERHAGPREVPAIKVRLATDHRDLFDARGAGLFAKWVSRSDVMLRLFNVVDDQATVKRAGKKPWKILRAGRVVFTCWGELSYLANLKVKVHPTEAKAGDGVHFVNSRAHATQTLRRLEWGRCPLCPLAARGESWCAVLRRAS